MKLFCISLFSIFGEILCLPGIWIGNSPFCGAKPSDCDFFGLDYVRTDRSEDGGKCWIGNKVLCQVKPLSDASTAGINRDPNQLTVVTYNIYQRPFFNGHDGQQERVFRIPRVIATNHPETDVIVLQEAFIGEVMGVSLRSLFSYYGFPYSTPTVGNDSSSINHLTVQSGGVFIVSRWPIIETASTVFQHFNIFGADQFSRKGVGYARVKKTGLQDYHIFGTHFQSQLGDANNRARILQAGEFKAFVDSISIPSSERVVLTGDMNVDWINDLDHVTQVMTSLDATIVPKSNQSLWATFDSTNNDLVKEDHQREWLDYVMYSNGHRKPTKMFMRSVLAEGLKPFSYCASAPLQPYYVFPDSNWCKRKLVTKHLSDHFPIVAKLYY